MATTIFKYFLPMRNGKIQDFTCEMGCFLSHAWYSPSMSTKEVLETPDAIERAATEFARSSLWRWKTGGKITAMNAAKLAKCLGLELGFKNGEFYYWRAK